MSKRKKLWFPDNTNSWCPILTETHLQNNTEKVPTAAFSFPEYDLKTLKQKQLKVKWMIHVHSCAVHKIKMDMLWNIWSFLLYVHMLEDLNQAYQNPRHWTKKQSMLTTVKYRWKTTNIFQFHLSHYETMKSFEHKFSVILPSSLCMWTI